ncbi:Hypothetical_protein [Hexamita inflata]|uniref:Hypothetical_protein n=1 Tax=Hexamita inflata TaxID=28002 RepID=A0AA86NM31_9EUKA|nr:Hypothetical protein HINF_LOCUS9442 [Hexamita inflata]CAI9930211.1 Hypothetical protein HINF_LOCUS17856 [Hexamita inflata]CAI9940552.1 Hypothetical protein HINF_LOCUS28197 [Hexamita inflata]
MTDTFQQQELNQISDKKKQILCSLVQTNIEAQTVYSPSQLEHTIMRQENDEENEVKELEMIRARKKKLIDHTKTSLINAEPLSPIQNSIFDCLNERKIEQEIQVKLQKEEHK